MESITEGSLSFGAIRALAIIVSMAFGLSGCSSTGSQLTANTSEFDGEWEGVMVCSACPGCVGPLEKPVSVLISAGEFVLHPDTTFHGIGRIDSAGIVQVRVGPESEPWYGWTRHRNFWFNGSYSDGTIDLHGQRGERTCELALQRTKS